jgi:uncharacterized protein Usg
LSQLLNKNPNEFFNSKEFTTLLSEYSELVGYDSTNKELYIKNQDEYDAFLHSYISKISSTKGEVTDKDFTNFERLTRELFLAFYGPSLRPVMMTQEQLQEAKKLEPATFDEAYIEINEVEGKEVVKGKVMVKVGSVVGEAKNYKELQEEQYTRNRGPVSKAWRRLGLANEFIGGRKTRVQKKRKSSDGKQHDNVTVVKALLGSNSSDGRVFSALKDFIASVQVEIKNGLELIRENGKFPEIEKELEEALEYLDSRRRFSLGKREIPKILETISKIQMFPKEDFWAKKDMDAFYKELMDLVVNPVQYRDLMEIADPSRYDLNGNHMETRDKRYLRPQISIIKNEEGNNDFYIDGGKIGVKPGTAERNNFEANGLYTTLDGVYPTFVKISTESSPSASTSDTTPVTPPTSTPPTSNGARPKVDLSILSKDELTERERLLEIIRPAVGSKLFENAKNRPIEELRIIAETYEGVNLDDVNNYDDTEYFNYNDTIFAETSPGKVITIQKAEEILRRIFPDLKLNEPQEVVKFVSKAVLSKYSHENSEILGKLHNGVISLVKLRGNKTYEQVVYHELIHYAKKLMTPKERALMDRAVKKLYPDISNSQVNEAIAELYQQREGQPQDIGGYIPYRVKKFLNFIADLFNIVLFHRTNLEEMFRRVDAGHFATSAVNPTVEVGISNEDSYPEHMKYVVENFGSTYVFDRAQTMLKKAVSKYTSPVSENPRRNGKLIGLDGPRLPLSYEEIFDEIIREVVLQWEITNEAVDSLWDDFIAAPEDKKDKIKANMKRNSFANKMYSSLLDTNTQTNKLILSEMLEYIFPSINANMLDEYVKESFTDDLSTEDVNENAEIKSDEDLVEEHDGITKETQDSSTINWEKTQTLGVKNFLSFIKVLDFESNPRNPQPTGEFLNPGLAYKLTLDLLVAIGDLNSDKDTINKRLSYIQKNYPQNSYSRSVMEHFRKLLLRKNTTPRNTTNKYIVQKTTEHSSYPQYYIIETNNTYDAETSYPTYEQAVADPSIKVISKGFTKVVDLFQASQIPHMEFIEKFERLEAESRFRELQSYLGSLKETTYYIANLKRGMKGFSYNFIKARELGEAVNIKSQFAAFINKVVREEENLSYGTTIKQLLHLISTAKNRPTKRNIKALKSKLAGHLSLSVLERRGISDKLLTTQLDGLEAMFSSLENLDPEGDYIKADGQILYKFDGDGKYIPQTENNVDNWLKHNSNYINNLVKAITFNSPKVRAGSIISATRRKIYKYHMSSFAYDFFNKVVNWVDVGILKKDGTELRQEDFIKEHSIFGKSGENSRVSTVHSVGEIDAYKLNQFGKEFNSKWLRLNKSKFYNVLFLSSFLDQALTRKTNQRYFQPLFQQSNKPRPIGAMVDVLSVASASVETEEGKRLLSSNQFLEGVERTFKLIFSQPDISLHSKNYKHLQLVNASLYREVINEKFESPKALETYIKENGGLESDKVKTVIKDLAKRVEEKVTLEAYNVAKEMIEFEVPIQGSKQLIDLLDQKTNPEHLQELLSSQGIKVEFSTLEEKVYRKIGNNQVYLPKVSSILPIVDLFVKNYFINAYHATHMITGTFDAFKNAEDVVKRLSGAVGPGSIGSYDTNDKTFRAVVVGDNQVDYEEGINMLTRSTYNKDAYEVIVDEEGNKSYKLTYEGFTEQEKLETEALRLFYDLRGFESTDAQAFITSKRAAALRKAFGPGYKMGSVTKPMYYGTRTVQIDGQDVEIQTYVKTSAVELSQDLIDSIPNSRLLEIIKNRMESENIDELYFASAVKLGLPRNTLNWEDVIKGDVEIPPASILDLNNDQYRMQLNPRSKTDSETALFTQLMYFLNVLGTNNERAHRAYSAVSYLLEHGMREFDEKTSSKSKIRDFLRKSLGDIADERLDDLLRGGISIDNPLIEKRMVVKLASAMEKVTTKIKLPGSKFVLQSDVGIKKDNGEDVVFKREENGNLVAEMIIPRGLLSPEDEASIDEQVKLFGAADLLGWRIPSTELHSAVAVRVVGFYDSKKTNVIVAPKLLVALHGSDFDVDSLFVVKRPVFKNDLYTSTSLSLKSFTKVVKTLQKNMEKLITNYSEDPNKTEKLKSVQKLISSRIYSGNLNSSVKLETIHKLNSDQFQNKISGFYTRYLKDLGLENSSESKKSFERDFGVVWSPIKEQWQINSQLLFNIESIVYELAKDQEFTDLVPEVKNIFQQYYEAVFELSKKGKSKNQKYTAGELIGYTKTSKGKAKYKKDTSVEQVIEKEIITLENLLEDAKENNYSLLIPLIKSNLNKWNEAKLGLAKNIIIETMLETIQDPNNNSRMNKPIFKGKWSARTKDDSKYTDQSALSILDELGLIDKSELDLSLFSNSFTAFKSVSDGSILTGILANSIKALAYMIRSGDTKKMQDLEKELEGLQATKKGFKKEEALDKILEIDKKIEKIKRDYKEASLNAGLDGAAPSINSKFHFKYGRYNIDRLREVTIADDQIIWDLLDSLVNVAIDNVKDQDLPKLNATLDTVNALVALISMGLPSKDVVLLINQPAVKWISEEANKPKKNFNIALRDAIKMIETEISKILPEGGKLDSALSMSRSRQIALIKKIPTFQAALESENMDILTETYNVLKIFENANKVGEMIKDMSSFLSILREMPVTFDRIEKIDSLGNALGKTSFPVASQMSSLVYDDTLSNYAENMKSFNVILDSSHKPIHIPLFFKQNPHVLSSYRALKLLKGVIENNMEVHSPWFRKFVKGLKLPLRIDNGTPDSADSEIRREVVRYLLTQSIPIDFSKITAKVTTSKRKKYTIFGTEAWSYKFIKKVEALQAYERKMKEKDSTFRSNKFLDAVSIQGEGAYKSIRFAQSTQLSPADLRDVERDFVMLRNYSLSPGGRVDIVPENERLSGKELQEFQKEFVYYGILNFGLNYSFSNYGRVLPAFVFVEQQNELKEIFHKLKTNDFYQRQVGAHLKRELLRENASSITTYVDTRVVGDPVNKSDKFIVIGKTANGKDIKIPDYSGSVTVNVADEDSQKAPKMETIYYDRAYKNITPKDERKSKNEVFHEYPKFFSSGSGRNQHVFERIDYRDTSYKDDLIIYQRIATSNGAYEKLNIVPDQYKAEWAAIDYLTNDYTIPTVFVTDTSLNVSNNKKFANYLGTNKLVRLVSYKDMSRMNPAYVKVVDEITERTVQRRSIKTGKMETTTVEVQEYVLDKVRMRELQDFVEPDFLPESTEHYTIQLEDGSEINATYNPENDLIVISSNKEIIPTPITKAQLQLILDANNAAIIDTVTSTDC